MSDSAVNRVLAEAAAPEKGVIYASGVSGGQSAYLASKLIDEFKGQMLIITSSYERAVRLEEYLSFYAGEIYINIFPDEERNLFSFDARSRALSFRRISALSKIVNDEPGIYIAPVMAVAKAMISSKEFNEEEIYIHTGDDIDVKSFLERLVDIGYERSEMAELHGQFSVRGGIIDVYPPDSEDPYRIDLFDTEVDSLKSFDPMTQRSIRQLQEITVTPALMRAPEKLNEAEYMWDYFSDDVTVFADDWDRICEQRNLSDKEWSSTATSKESGVSQIVESFANMEDIANALIKRNSVVTMPFKKQLKFIESQKAIVELSFMDAMVCNGRMDYYGNELKRLLKEHYEVHVACSTSERLSNLRDFAFRTEITGNVDYVEGILPSGLYITDDKIAWISDNDIFRSTKKKRRKKSSKGRQIKSFTDLKTGDYVVHENHGIGKFVGIEPLVVEGIRRDYMKIRYAGDDVLYVPVEQMDLIQSYIGSGGTSPKVNKLSGEDWRKTKARAKAAIEEMAEELVKLTAERKLEKGYGFGADTVWQHEFEELFPYQETDNQLRCIEEIKRDMETPWPMDRLLCGDVGFGKTEVAARAIFKCIMDGKQAAVLVPTTILANQHYHTFLERFERFPCNIDMLSRFRSDAAQKSTVKKLAEGNVDVLIGTHRLLSDDVKFKDLGLLVIDEEQRFGVQHKEAIKFLKKNVDVLTLTATPIPRTLHMSLSGIRSMSTLEEPPEERYPVQTYVMEQDDMLVREMLMREMDRGGQAFVIFNRVKGINRIAEGLRQLVPEARIAVAHGQMSELRLEDIMNDFMEHEYDVLVATTIIESGIDIPNANTLIVLDADNYGLAQLYQLRGRVGRSNRAAYAYLMYKKDKVISEMAEKRLRAIREFTEFGSGFRIAMKDLEIRGAGNLLGTAQSGHMMMIGYELYCKLIDDAVRRLGGEKVEDNELEVLLELKVDAYISSDYIGDEGMKLDMYKRIAEIGNAEDISDVTDELLDRFGDVPEETTALMKVALIQSGCRRVGIRRVYLDAGKVVFEFLPEGEVMKPEIMAALSDRYGMNILINLSSRPFMKIPAQKGIELLNGIIEFLDICKG